jgi:hypothetical protein
MSPDELRNVEVVRCYFDACGSGDFDTLLGTLTEGVVHYFLPARFSPIIGAERLARHWCKFKDALQPVWSIDHLIARDNEVVTEWSCQWTPHGTTRRIMMRGSEWYVMRDFRIAEIRAYLIDDNTAHTELAGFPYAARGYPTL